jgi:succinate dehydrogenase/fumarate reductase-like Fe-S protein
MTAAKVSAVCVLFTSTDTRTVLQQVLLLAKSICVVSNDGDTITVEPWRSAGFPVIKDLMVDRTAYDKIMQAGGYVSVRTGAPQDAKRYPDRETYR